MKSIFEFLKSFVSSRAAEKIFLGIICLCIMYFGIVTIIHHQKLHFLTEVIIIAIGLVVAIIAILAGLSSIFREIRVYLMTRKVQLSMPINTDDYVIDLDADPFILEEWTVERHQKGGIFKWNPNEIQFYLSKRQMKGTINGNKLSTKLTGKPVFNANLLDWLLIHQNLIPEEWKHDEHGCTRYIFFWGTIYRNSSGALCIRYIYPFGGKWDWDLLWLGHDWNVQYPAALRVN